MKFVGKSHLTTRTITGFRSLDLAFPMFSKTGEVKIGIPNNIPYYVYGAWGMGKSTLCNVMAGSIAGQQGKNIVLRSIEGFDEEWQDQQLSVVGFGGKLILAEGMVDKKGDEKEEYNIDELIRQMRNEEVAVGILDSVAGLQPAMERDADSIIENQMGRRAQLSAKAARHVTNVNLWRQSPCAFFAITHEYKAYSQYEPSTKPGGDAIKYLTRCHISVGRIKWAQDLKYILDDGSYIIKGVIDKFNYGIRGKEFYVFILSNYGAHLGMSAVFDAIQYGVAKRKAGRIVLGEWSYTLNEMLKQARDGNDEFFQPVADALQDTYSVQPKKKDGDEEDD
jgi:RecA/RadA recombinase